MASTRRPRQSFPPVTMGHVRSHGCRELLVYCTSLWCNHSATLNGDWLPDETVLLDLDSRMVCTACGLIGADVRPDWTPITGVGGMGGAHRYEMARVTTDLDGGLFGGGRGDPWQAPLMRAIVLRDGRARHLHEARAYIIALPEGHQTRKAWQKTAELLMVAATSRESIAAATKQIELALFIEGKWLLPK